MAKLDDKARNWILKEGYDPEHILDLLAVHPFRRCLPKDIITLNIGGGLLRVDTPVRECYVEVLETEKRLVVRWVGEKPIMNMHAWIFSKPIIVYPDGTQAFLKLVEGCEVKGFESRTLNEEEVKLILGKCEKMQRIAVDGRSEVASAMHHGLVSGGYLP